MAEAHARAGAIWGAPLVIIALLGVACASNDEPIAISDVRIGLPAGPNAALYFTATSSGGSDRLVGAETDAAASIEVHETIQDDDGSMGMRAMEGLDLSADGSLVLEPGAAHLMLVEVSDLEIGENVQVTLVWKQAGRMVIEAEVVDPAAVVGN